MGEEKSSEQTKQPPQPQPNDITEQRLQVLEKTNEKMFTILVWGFGTLSALAFALVAGNIYSSHSSYEKDTATLKQDVEMLHKQLILAQQELADSNNKTFQDFKNEITASFMESSNNVQNALIRLDQTNTIRWHNVVTAITNSSFAVWMQISNNLMTLNDAIHAEVNLALTNTVSNINEAFGRNETHLNEKTSQAIGAAMMAQARVDLRAKQPTILEAGNAAETYLNAAEMFLVAKDAVNFKRCVESFYDDCLPPLLNQTTKSQFTDLLSRQDVQKSLTKVIELLDKLNTNGVYSDVIYNLRHASELIKAKIDK
jgi:hypothetical protein